MAAPKIDRKAVLDAAQKLVLKGKLDDAVKEYEKILAADPKDELVLKALGDIHSRLKNVPEAIKAYRKLADFYMERGFAVKALAVYKSITKLDPASIENNLKLADLQAQQGFANEAKMQYAAVADRCAGSGMKDKAIEILKKIGALDASDFKFRLKLAELLKERGQKAEAVAEYLAVGKNLLAKGAFDDVIKVLKAGLAVDASNPHILGALGEAYSAKGDLPNAFALFEDLLKKDPKNAGVMVHLGRTYLQAKDTAKAEDILRKAQQADPVVGAEGLVEIGRHHLRQGDPDKAFEAYKSAAQGLLEREGADIKQVAAILEEFTKHHAHNPQAFSLLATLYQQMNQPTHAANAMDGQVEAHLARNEFEAAARVLEKLVAAEPQNAQRQEQLKHVRARMGGVAAPTLEVAGGDVVAAKPKAAPAPAVSQKAQDIESAMASEDDLIVEAITEADVFVKYGLMAKAVEKLQFAKMQFPRNIEIRTKLLGIYNEQGNRAKAVEECVDLSKLFRELGDDDAAQDILNDAREIDPHHPLLQHMEAPSAAKAAPSDDEDADEGIEIDMDEEIEEVEEAEEGEEEEAEALPGLDDADETSLEVEPTPAPAKREPTLDESLEEADFYIAQGFRDEAVTLLKSLAAKFPGDARVANKLAKLDPAAAKPSSAPAPKPAPVKQPEKKAAPPPPPPAPAAVADVMSRLDAIEESAEGEDFFDLAAEMESDLMVDAASPERPQEEIGELFAAFKQGVSQQIESQDYETHYNLGIAYKEMGLVDEAIAEFQVAAKNPDKARYMDCCSMLGVCFMDKGLPAIAAKWYRKGLDVQGLSDEDYMGLRYDLAVALEQDGQTEEAYQMYAEVYGSDSTYRDVAAKMKSLKAARA